MSPKTLCGASRTEREAERLRTQADDHLITIEHVGSTVTQTSRRSPFWTCSPSWNLREEVAATFSGAGYDRRSNEDAPDRVFLARGPQNGRTHHLSVTDGKAARTVNR